VTSADEFLFNERLGCIEASNKSLKNNCIWLGTLRVYPALILSMEGTLTEPHFQYDVNCKITFLKKGSRALFGPHHQNTPLESKAPMPGHLPNIFILQEIEEINKSFIYSINPPFI